MDILRKELDAIYASQHLGTELLDEATVDSVTAHALSLATLTDGCAVVTDVSCDRCYIHAGHLGALLGITDSPSMSMVTESSDEDDLYNRIHPEDLVEKRMLEYELFRMVDAQPDADKTAYRASCRLRMRVRDDRYRMVDNTTHVVQLSPAGKIWLILCTYVLSASPAAVPSDIEPRIMDCRTGDFTVLSLSERRSRLLSQREKEVLALIRDGKPSKQIADTLGISVHTVNRHRQNIIGKLSVGNSVEAVSAAMAMRLL